MSLNPPTPGLRRLRYNAASPAKVSLVVQPGDRLDVSADVAAQLVASSAQFKAADAPPHDPEPEPEAAEPEPEAAEPEAEAEIVAPKRTRKSKS